MPVVDLPSPTEHGGSSQDGKLSIQWTVKDVVPQAIVDILVPRLEQRGKGSETMHQFIFELNMASAKTNASLL